VTRLKRGSTTFTFTNMADQKGGGAFLPLCWLTGGCERTAWFSTSVFPAGGKADFFFISFLTIFFLLPQTHLLSRAKRSCWSTAPCPPPQKKQKRKRSSTNLLNLPVCVFLSFFPNPPHPPLLLLLLLLFCFRRCKLGKGYLKMFLVPPGARHVIIQEHEASPQILGKLDWTHV